MSDIMVRRGFTLIELLVVIAIIGILASVVLASLNSARDKASNAAIRANVRSAHAQAAMYHDTGRTYTLNVVAGNTACLNTKTDSPMGVSDIVLEIDSQNGAGPTLCNNDSNSWAMAAQLIGDDATDYFCTDSTGFSGQLTGIVGGSNPGDFTATDLTCN